MAEDQQPAIHEQETLPMPTYSQAPLTQVISSPIPADISTAHLGVPIGHPPPIAQTASNLMDPARFTALEGMVNQLATNMATDMTELMAMLKDQNRASSSFTPPPEHRPIVDPNPTVPLTFVSEGRILLTSPSSYLLFLGPDRGEAKTRLLAPSILDIRLHSRFRWTTPLHCRLLRHMHILCPTKRCKLISRPRQLLSSRNLCNSMLLLRLNKVDPRLRDLLSRLNVLQPRELNRVVMLKPRPHKPYTTLPAPPSHIFRQLLAGNKIIIEALGPNFDPAVQNQNLCCEFHQCAPDHTLDNCWTLRNRIQEMIDTRQISFNEVNPPNVRSNPLPDHVSEVAFAVVSFVIEVLAKEPYQDSRVPWTYEGEVANAELEMSAIGIMRSGRVYQGPEPADKGKAPATAFSTVPEAVPLPTKKVTDQEAETFMKVSKASENKVVEQIGKSPAHISLLALLLSSEPHRNALLKVLTTAQVPKDTTPYRIEETVNSIFSNQIFFADDELPSEGQGHLRALHIVCKCNNHVVGRVMIDSGFALNVCPVSMLKQMNIPNAFSLLLGRPWIHAAGAVPSSLHQKLKFFVEGKLITVNGEEDYAVYKETAVPYISIGEDQNLPFHSFDTISVIRDYGEVGPSQTDRMIGKVLFKNDYVPVEAFLALPAIYAVIGETSSKVHIRPVREDEELTNWTLVPLYLAIVADV
ncbi:hypothetical protein CRG98_012003 [Punica granatum]|uniref:Uncharacterized protein n=1 Tax=Punica granatum TaxID=22663 RepID=A0A2I0KGZ0_PUNGR|nr:hypothetical protein CRG98_012003 [Punica granatum]